jgi:hypothetical protein
MQRNGAVRGFPCCAVLCTGTSCKFTSDTPEVSSKFNSKVNRAEYDVAGETVGIGNEKLLGKSWKTATAYVP